jgi:hypothetical protein
MRVGNLFVAGEHRRISTLKVIPKEAILTDSSDGRRIFVLGELCRERLYDRIRTVDVRLLSVPEDTPGTARIIKTVLGAGRAVQVYPSGRLHHDVAQNDVAKGSPTRT